MKEIILLIDIGSTFTKVTAVDMKEEKILATARAFTTVATDVNEGLDKAVALIKEQIGDFEPTKRLVASSAAGGLKMISIGLVPELTVKAAKTAALSAGAKLAGSYSFALCDDEAEEIAGIRPDIVLLSGGTDGGNAEVILHNAKMLADIPLNFPVVVAGNKKCAKECGEIITASGKTAYVTENVMPAFNKLNIIPAQDVIRSVFLERIIKAKGITKIAGLIEGIIMPTPSAVLKAATLLAKGTEISEGIGDLILVDMGGATTDVYSVCKGKPTNASAVMKGLPEPYSKRTVEGDLGARYTAESVVEAYGMKKFCLKSGLSEEEVNGFFEKIRKDKSYIASTEKEIAFDKSVAGAAVELAVTRHAGTLESFYTCNGIMFMQTGKDLSNVKTVIGTGGPIIGKDYAAEVLSGAKYDPAVSESLRPKEPEYYIDRKYVFAAMGLLSELYPETALKILKEDTIRIG